MGERRKEHNEKRKRVVQALKTQENVKSAAKGLAVANPKNEPPPLSKVRLSA